MSQIFTCLHKALENNWADGHQLQRLRAMAMLPHFVFERDLYAQLQGDSMVKSMVAMKEAGVLRLPYPEMMVELWLGPKPFSDFRYFTKLSETGTVGVFRAQVVEWVNDSLWPKSFDATFTWEVAMPDHSVPVLDLTGGASPPITGEPGFQVAFTDPTRQDIIPHLTAAIMLAVMMTNISGLERETVEPKELKRLNKSREARGKPRITTHTVVRIGHVYNEAGQKVRITDGNRRQTAIHMRSAHTRRQQHGRKWEEENPELAALPSNLGDHHIVLIPAVLVNFKDGSELPLPKPKVVKL